MIGQTREDLFALARQKRKEEKKEEGSRYKSFTYESNEYCALSRDTYKIVRFLGNPPYSRISDSDALISYIARIKADDGKTARIIFPDYENNKSWILWKIRDTVLESTYERDELGDNKRKYLNVKSHPETFWRVYKNDITDPNKNKYENGWKPTAYVNLNVLDRQDSWCADNHHTKLLSGRAWSPDNDNANVYYEPGIKKTLYTYVWDNVIECGDGKCDQYDIAIKTLGVDPWYSAYSCELDTPKIPEEYRKFIHHGPLTEEEKTTYEEYNITDMFRITPYIRILSKLGEFIKKVDMDYHTKFYDELVALKEEEGKKFESEGKNKWGYVDSDNAEEPSTKSYSSPVSNTQKTSVLNSETVPESKKEEVKTRTAPVVSASIDWVGLSEGKYAYKAGDKESAEVRKAYGGNLTPYLGIQKMTDEEKQMVTGIDSNGQLLYSQVGKDGKTVSVLKDPKTGFLSPENFHVDPLTGVIYS